MTTPVNKTVRWTWFLLAAAVVLAIVFFSTTRSVKAEERPRSSTFYNDKGQEIGRSTTHGGSTTIQDNAGRDMGRIERRPDGSSNIYDSKGHQTGTIRR